MRTEMNLDVKPLWEKACGHLKEILNPDIFARWIAVITPLEIRDDSLVLSVENDFYQTWLEDNYLPLIVNALRLSGAPESLHAKFTVRQQEQPLPAEEPQDSAAAPEEKKKPARKIKGSLVTPLNERLTFEEFVVGPQNTFAQAAAITVAQAPGKAYNPLYIYGQSGLGKTHLLQAIGNRVAKESSGTRVAYITTETLLNEYVNALRNKTMQEFRDRYRKVDVLLVDDVHFVGGKESLQDEFFHTFNALFDARRQIVMTSDRSAREIQGLQDRLVTRFQWGLVTELEKPDFETRLAILRNKQQSAKAPLREEILMFIAENVQSNVRALEGAMMKALYHTALYPKVPVTIETLREVLKEFLDKEQLQDLTIEEIQRMVATCSNISMKDMSSEQRTNSVALPRQIAMYLSRKLTRASLQEIANAFGKTHATVLHGIKAIQNRIDTEDKMRNDIRQITRRLGRDPINYQL